MFRDYRVTVDYRLLRGRTSGMGGGMTYSTWYHLMYWYDMIWYDMIPDNVIWCQWIICCTIWCSLVFIYLLVFDIHIDYLTWPYYHLINEYRLKKCTADFVTGSWSISHCFGLEGSAKKEAQNGTLPPINPLTHYDNSCECIRCNSF